MAGLVLAIHVFGVRGAKNVDARDKPGHDGERKRDIGRSQLHAF
jgi:hypothetical protein